MSTAILDRRHAAPVLPAADLAPGDRFTDPATGQEHELSYHRPGAGDDTLAVATHPVLASGRVSKRLQYLYLDPSALVNVWRSPR